MKITELRTLQDCEDLLNGALWLATGGGGMRERGISLLKEVLDEGLYPSWVNADSIDDNTLTATVGIHGSGVPGTLEVLNEARAMGLIGELGGRSIAEALHSGRSLPKAVIELGNYLDEKIGCLVAGEIGAGALSYPLMAGAHLGIPVVDGDYSGRAVPEEQQGTYCLYGKQQNMLATVDTWGNAIIIKQTVNIEMLERFCKLIAVGAYGSTAIAGVPLPASEMKEILIPGTLTKCLKVGQTVRQARQRHQDPIADVLSILKGWRLFEGQVTEIDRQVSSNGYLEGSYQFEGTGDYVDQKLKIWFKNENHITWLNGKPWVCSPDLISVINRNTFLGTNIPDINPGDDMVVVGMPGHEGFRSKRGLELSGPRHYGFDIEYVPIEELMASR